MHGAQSLASVPAGDDCRRLVGGGWVGQAGCKPECVGLRRLRVASAEASEEEESEEEGSEEEEETEEEESDEETEETREEEEETQEAEMQREQSEKEATFQRVSIRDQIVPGLGFHFVDRCVRQYGRNNMEGVENPIDGADEREKRRKTKGESEPHPEA